MKHSISIVLVVLLLMNTLGYYGIFLGIEYQHGEQMERAFDEGTDDASKEVVVRMPISIPYNTGSPFQRVDGTFEYEGEFYRLVKQRLVNDTLEVVLMKDDRQRKMHEDLVRYTDQHSTNGGITKTVDFIKDYLPQTTDILPASEGWQRMLNREPLIMKLLISYHQLESPPPKQV